MTSGVPAPLSVRAVRTAVQQQQKRMWARQDSQSPKMACFARSFGSPRGPIPTLVPTGFSTLVRRGGHWCKHQFEPHEVGHVQAADAVSGPILPMTGIPPRFQTVEVNITIGWCWPRNCRASFKLGEVRSSSGRSPENNIYSLELTGPFPSVRIPPLTGTRLAGSSCRGNRAPRRQHCGPADSLPGRGSFARCWCPRPSHSNSRRVCRSDRGAVCSRC